MLRFRAKSKDLDLLSHSQPGEPSGSPPIGLLDSAGMGLSNWTIFRKQRGHAGKCSGYPYRPAVSPPLDRKKLTLLLRERDTSRCRASGECRKQTSLRGVCKHHRGLETLSGKNRTLVARAAPHFHV